MQRRGRPRGDRPRRASVTYIKLHQSSGSNRAARRCFGRLRRLNIGPRYDAQLMRRIPPWWRFFRRASLGILVTWGSGDQYAPPPHLTLRSA
jgi:hypothetical protein